MECARAIRPEFLTEHPAKKPVTVVNLGQIVIESSSIEKVLGL
jgi:hypothetical protein